MKDLKVYILPDNIDTEDVNNLTDVEFMALAETDGEIYTLEAFQSYWNCGVSYSFNSECSYLRIL